MQGTVYGGISRSQVRTYAPGGHGQWVIIPHYLKICNVVSVCYIMASKYVRMLFHKTFVSNTVTVRNPRFLVSKVVFNPIRFFTKTSNFRASADPTHHDFCGFVDKRVKTYFSSLCIFLVEIFPILSLWGLTLNVTSFDFGGNGLVHYPISYFQF